MKTKLAYLCSSHSWGGLEMNQLRNAQWMQERGHDIIVLGIKGTPFEAKATELKLPFVVIDKFKKYYPIGATRKVGNILLDLGVTHLIIRSNTDMSLASGIKFWQKNKIHISYFMEMQLGVEKKGLLHNWRFNRLDLWSCPLNWLKSQVESMTNYRNKLMVIPSGMDISSFEVKKTSKEIREDLKLPQDRVVFGLIGRFDQQKGQLLVLEALKQCPNKNFSLLLLGEPTRNEDDDYYDRMLDLINSNDLLDRVEIRGYRDDVASIYHGIDWLIMATKAETFGMVTIECMACGTPVLGSNAGGTPELLQNGETGMLFESQSASSLSEMLELIVTQNIQFKPEKLKESVSKFDHHLVCTMVETALDLKSNK